MLLMTYHYRNFKVKYIRDKEDSTDHIEGQRNAASEVDDASVGVVKSSDQSGSVDIESVAANKTCLPS